MSQRTKTEHFCDRCGKLLQGFSNSLNIVTEKSDSESYWARFHVKIEINSGGKIGGSNYSKREDADLCRGCASALLSDALDRVRKDERATKGAEEVAEQGWNG